MLIGERKSKLFKLFDSDGSYNRNVDALGKKVEFVPPCLDPYLPVEERNLNTLG